MKFLKNLFILVALVTLTACSSSSNIKYSGTYLGSLDDPIMTIAILNQEQQKWAGTPYVLGGQSYAGIDCSGFVQKILLDHFGMRIPRTTKEQALYGKQIQLKDTQTGDLVFFKTGRGPNGYHVGIYVKNGLFLHASTKGGVVYSSMRSPYWIKTYWQTRRI